ncbi:MAG: DUF4330 domain-containing protein [Clostridia bacterium]|nr:DUF4330 domain-containing protein [Clostridia bacterium]
MLVVVVLVAGLVGLFWQKGVGQARPVASRTLEVTVLVSNLRPPSVEAMKAGQVVYDAQGVQALGTVVKKSVQPTPQQVALPDGRLVVAPSPLYSDVTLVIRGPGTVSPQRMLLAGQEVRIGSSLSMETRDWASTGYVVAVRVVR